MSENKKKTALALAIFATFWFIVGGLCGFFAAKGIYDQPLEERVSRDTTTTIDTIPDIAPAPKDSTPVKTVVRWLPMAVPKIVHDTIDNVVEEINFLHTHDTVAVEVPITSKHYQADEYDAWVSGFEANLDSIKVYQKETVITETITRMKPPNKLSLDVEIGTDYMTAEKEMSSYAYGDLTYNIKESRFAVGVRGGVLKMPTEKAQPNVGLVLKYRVF